VIQGTSRPVALGVAQRSLLQRQEATWPQSTGSIALTYLLDGELESDAMQGAVRAVLDRHPQLRLQSEPDGDGWTAWIVATDDLPLPLTWIDLRDVAPARRDTVVRLLGERDAARPFDHRREAPVRFAILRVAEDRHILLLTMCHVSSDGGSAEVIVDDLLRTHDALRAQGAADDDVPGVQDYADYVAKDDARRERGDALRHVGWWADRLGEANPLAAPARGTAPPLGDTTVAFTHETAVNETVVDVLATLAQVPLAREQVALTAAYAAVLALRGLGSNAAFLVPYVGERFPRHARTVGVFATRIYVRAPIAVGTDTMRSVVTRLGEDLLEALEHAGVAFDAVSAELQRRGGPPLPSGSVQLALRVPAVTAARGGTTARFDGIRTTATVFEHFLFAAPRAAGTLGLYLCHQLRWASIGQGAALLATVATTLPRLAAEPDRPLDGSWILS